MYGFDCLPARPFSNTEDQAVFFVKPVRVVLHTVPLLDSHVLSMGLGDVLWRGSRNMVAIDVHRHRLKVHPRRWSFYVRIAAPTPTAGSAASESWPPTRYTCRRRAEMLWGRIGTMNAERCGECGFDSDDWSDATAIEAIQRLPRQWRSAVAGLTPNDLQRRPIDQMWSIAEYADHVREVLFGMRFLLDTAISQPGTDLGRSPTQPFASQPRRIDVEAALDGIDHEAHSLSAQLSGLSSHDWLLTVRFDSAAVDPHWIARHAVHDASHHLLDSDRLRSAL